MLVVPSMSLLRALPCAQLPATIPSATTHLRSETPLADCSYQAMNGYQQSSPEFDFSFGGLFVPDFASEMAYAPEQMMMPGVTHYDFGYEQYEQSIDTQESTRNNQP